MRHIAMGLLLVVSATACASTGGSGSRTTRNEITRAEVEAARGVSTAQDLIKRLRPQWLRGRGSGTFNRTLEEGIIIYVDGVRAGVIPVQQTTANQSVGPNPLESLSAEQVGRMVYYNAPDATQKFGTGHAFGAIEVITRR